VFIYVSIQNTTLYLIITNNKANPCWKSKCSKSGTCDYNSTINNFTCNCFDGYNGTFCQNCKYLSLLKSINININNGK